MTYEDDLPPQARAARVAYLLTIRGQLSTDEIKEATGIRTHPGVIYLMDNVSLALPLYKSGIGRWALLPMKDDR